AISPLSLHDALPICEAIQLASNNSFVVLTFSNLNPSLRYNFKGSAVRGGTGDYTNRWTKITILGATSAAAAHTANALTSVQAPRSEEHTSELQSQSK